MNENETSISDSVHDISSIHIDNTNCCTQLNIPSECHFPVRSWKPTLLVNNEMEMYT